MLTAFHLAGRLRTGLLLGCGAMAQLVARLHGMQKVRGSNPLSSTQVRGRFRSRKPAFLVLVQQQSTAAAL
jgi:hypothetical protein